ncbi:coiled-coil related, partial [Cystoisospora suis]
VECLYTEDLAESGQPPSYVLLPPDLRKEIVFARSSFARLHQRYAERTSTCIRQPRHRPLKSNTADSAN